MDVKLRRIRLLCDGMGIGAAGQRSGHRCAADRLIGLEQDSNIEARPRNAAGNLVERWRRFHSQRTSRRRIGSATRIDVKSSVDRDLRATIVIGICEVVPKRHVARSCLGDQLRPGVAAGLERARRTHPRRKLDALTGRAVGIDAKRIGFGVWVMILPRATVSSTRYRRHPWSRRACHRSPAPRPHWTAPPGHPQTRARAGCRDRHAPARSRRYSRADL